MYRQGRIVSDRRILVSGASRGIGRALVEHFIKNGDRVVGCARSTPDFEHANYTHVEADITDENDVKSLFREVRSSLGGLDILINNAGAARMSPMVVTPAETAANIFDLNFMGTFRLSSAAVRLLRKSDAGRIVNVTTVAVPLRLEGESVYAASKAAVESFTRIVAKELGPLGITCNAIGPSPIPTALIKGISDDKIQALLDQQAVKEWATPEDVVNVVDFFVDPASRMVTGQIVYLAGVG
jgi:3-oxoacyl-[acyl-carrier protein] reductase